MTLNDFAASASTQPLTERMPVLFIGHGNPMNVLWDNPFTQSLHKLGKEIEPKPKAILVVSAHWLTSGTFVATTPRPETIYDFGGFPDEMYQQKYPAPGAPALAAETSKLLAIAHEDANWGLDHGAWTVLHHLYPNADIPVFQVSIDYNQPMQYHYDLAKKLASLRDRGVLIIGSGNIVHNLRAFFQNPEAKPFDWAIEFDTWVGDKLDNGDYGSLINYEKGGKAAMMSIPTVDHYVPMLYTLGLADKGERLVYTYQEIEASLSMRSFRIG